MKKVYRKFVLPSLAILIGLTACAVRDTEPLWQLPGERHRITVKEDMDRLNLVIGPEDAGLSNLQKQAVQAFAGAWRDHGHGPLAVSIPSGSANGPAAVTAAAQTRAALFAQGLNWNQIVGGHYDARGQVAAPVVLTFKRYTASAEGCSAAYQGLVTTFQNQPSYNFGCAVAANTAAMIADPHDLLSPRQQGPAESDRRMNQYDKYIKGENTSSTRSDEEKGTVSNVSNQ